MVFECGHSGLRKICQSVPGELDLIDSDLFESCFLL